MAEPLAGLALLFFIIRVLAAERVPARREKIVVADLDVHLRDLDRARRMVRYVEVDVERTELLKLKVVDHDARLIRQRQVKRLRLLAFDVLEPPYDLALPRVVLGDAILGLQWVKLLLSLRDLCRRIAQEATIVLRDI